MTSTTKDTGNATETEREEFEGLDEVLGYQGNPRLKFDNEVPADDPGYIYPMGTKVQVVIESARPRQERDYDTKMPKFWPSGDPQMALVYSGVTTDNGLEVDVWIDNKEKRNAHREALRAAAVKGPAKGDILEIGWMGNVKTTPKNGSRAKLTDTKVYEIAITPAGK